MRGAGTVGLVLVSFWLALGCRSTENTEEGGAVVLDEAASANKHRLDCPEGTSAVPAGEIAYQYKGRVCARPDGTHHGPFVAWFPGGAKQLEGQFRDGKRVGRWTWYERAGHPIRQGDFVDDRETGLFVEWRFGKKTGEAHYEAGKKVGEWTQWHVGSEVLASRRHYAAGKATGTHTRWHPNGVKSSEETFQDGLLEGTLTLWHPNGQKQREGAYAADKQIGVWIWWREDGTVEKRQDFGSGAEGGAEARP